MSYDPPQDIDAEQALLGAMLLSVDAIRVAAEFIQAADFYRPAHETIHDAIHALWMAGERIDPITVHQALLRDGTAARVGGPVYLHTLISSVPTAANADYYARIVAGKAAQRRMVEAGTRITQMAHQDTDPAEMVAYARTQLDAAVDERVGVGHLTRPIEAFMADTPSEPDWVIPGLIARGDRVVITGKGGIGKSTLARQLAVCSASGLDPFNYDRIDPIRVSVIDKENSDAQNHRRYSPLLTQARLSTDGEGVNGRLSLSGLSGRLDLLNARDALALLRTVERDKPDLVYIGPYYKLKGGADPDKEETVLKFTAVLDQIRDMGACTITEAHPNKAAGQGGDMAPSGSGAWNWWPEFGFGLRLDPEAREIRRVSLERWKIDRMESTWPETLESGFVFPWQEGPPLP